MKIRTKDGWYLRATVWNGQHEIPVSDENFLVWIARAMTSWTLMRGHEIDYNGLSFIIDNICYHIQAKEISIDFCASNGVKKRC